MKRFAAFVVVMVALAGSASADAATLRLNMQGNLDSLDPAQAYVTYSWQLEYATCLKLVNYPDAPAPAGSAIRTEAASTYRVSGDGLTYTFVVPDGKYVFSDGEPVTVASFVRAFTRTLDPALSSPARSFVHEIQGADAYANGAASTITGITTQGALLRIQLTQPAPDLLQRLAMPFFCAVPATTPSTPSNTIPSAGPYYVQSADLKGLTVLAPNPHYTGKRPRNWGEIDVHAFQDAFATESQLVTGGADWAFDGLPATDYGSFAAAHPSQFFVNPEPSLLFFILRSSRPLMADPSMRRAFNLVLDRNAIAQGPSPFAASATDQILPPGVPGFRDAAIFPFGGDLATAQALAAPHAGQTIVYLTCPTPRCLWLESIVVPELQSLGLNVQLWRVPRATQIAIEHDPTAPFDISPEGWVADYLDPFDFLNQFVRTGSGNNFSGFSDPLFDVRLDAAAQLAGQARADAYAQIDADIMRQDAPIAPYGVVNARDAFAARIGCQTFSAPFGMDLVALCLK